MSNRDTVEDLEKEYRAIIHQIPHAADRAKTRRAVKNLLTTTRRQAFDEAIGVVSKSRILGEEKSVSVEAENARWQAVWEINQLKEAKQKSV